MLYWVHKSPGDKCCFAANSFYCLRLPIQSNLRGGDPNAMLGVIIVLGVSAALQQTLFIVSGSPSNAMLGRGDQNTILGMKSAVGLMLLRSKLFLLSLAPHPIQC